MPTISAKVNKKELDAINEYANVCGESVSNLVRKAMIRHVTFMDGFKDSHCTISILYFDQKIKSIIIRLEKVKVTLFTF